MNLVSSKSATRLLAVAAAATMLAGCGSIHPGQAAVVGNTDISMSQVDERAAAYCQVSLASAQQQGINVLSNAELRRQAVSDLITLVIATDLAEQKSLTPDPTLYALTGNQREEIGKVFAKSHPEQVLEAIVKAQKTYALIIALGEDASGEELGDDNAQKLQAAGERVINSQMKKLDIDIDDRFGLDDTTAQISETGSRSVDEENLAAMPAEDLPVTQHCA